MIDRKAKEDVVIPLEWNDAKGHFQNFYTPENTNDAIPDRFVTCEEDSVRISHEFFEEKETGEYEYIMEFGDVGVSVKFIVK